MSTTLTSKGQVTIPKAVRDHLGIGPGSRVTFRLDDRGHVLVVPVSGEQPENRFRKLLGHAGPGPTTDEIMALLRDDD